MTAFLPYFSCASRFSDKHAFSTYHDVIFINLLRWDRVFDYQLNVQYGNVINLNQ